MTNRKTLNLRPPSDEAIDPEALNKKGRGWRFRHLCLLVMLSVFATTPAAARDFVSYASTTPILYRYAACMLDGSAATTDAQIEQCVMLKAELIASSQSVIHRFHVLERYDVERELRKGFREIERDLEQTRRRNRPVPKAIVGYLRCMGEGVMESADYQSGDAISYIGVEDACAATHIEATKDTVSSSETASIRALHRRFGRFGRLTYPLARHGLRRSRAGTRLLPAVRMDRSFLNIGLIRGTDND